MEQFVIGIAEKTVLGAGFFYLLHYLIKNMETITQNLNTFGVTLQDVSKTLLRIDMRVEQLEGRIKDLEQEGRL